jgi:hypothetical protein
MQTLRQSWVSILAFSDSVKPEGWQMKQCKIKNIKNQEDELVIDAEENKLELVWNFTIVP